MFTERENKQIFQYQCQPGEERYKAVLGVLQFWGVNAEMLSNCKRRAGGLEDHRDKSRFLSGPQIRLPSQSN
ncbi:hypothetical protein J6590_052958 [Homalodisca vitripennis]|nr:hypothetical protein J6590_052958 [Homalodisca vitripennis]